jgi:hypothetical protein
VSARISQVVSGKLTAMNTAHSFKEILAGTLLSGAVAVASVGLGAGVAQAQPGCATQTCWCPGKPLPSSNAPITWDMSVCHDWHYAWHDNPAAGNQVLDGPLDCGYGPGFLPQCKG